MDDVTLRGYHPDDAEAVWALHVAAMGAAGGADSVPGGNLDLERVVEEYLGTNGEFLVAEDDDGDLVAMGGFQPHAEDDDAAVIRRMRVDPDRQREGLGEVVLAELEARACDAGFERLTLDTSTDMTAAMAFYEAHGYREVDRERVSETDTTLVFYEKTL